MGRYDKTLNAGGKRKAREDFLEEIETCTPFSTFCC